MARVVKRMKYLSLCSGIEAATVAWHPLGWEAVAYSEIERFPSEVLAHHYPNTPNLGDMTKFKEWTNVSNVDLLVGGTPCQSFSVAGLRKGLDDPRGNLMLTYLAIADKFKPKWLVWENVLGVLSSNGGKDFGVFLGALGELGYGFAYRVLDAQYFGVAQRRRRVFVVGYLGDWRAAAAVLFERHSLQGHPAPSREKRQSAAASVGAGADGGNTDRVIIGHAEVTSAPCAADGPKGVSDQYAHEGKLIAMAHGQGGAEISFDRSPTLTCVHEAPIILDRAAFNQGENAQYKFRAEHSETMDSLVARGPHAVLQPTIIHGTQDPCVSDIAFAQGRNNGGENVLIQAVGTDLYNGNITGDVAATMGTPGSSSNASGPTVMQPVGAFKPGQSAKAHSIGYESEMAPTLEAGSGGNNKPAVHVGMAVRRLTPVECERLQGFGDNYTDIKSKGKPTPDGPRYKALGNSMAVPVMAWIGKRIQEVENIK
jgi:DNA (cytosine-5)-methyltransferase 1